MRSRARKITLIALSASISASMAIAAYLPLRARTDEKNVVGDIHHLLQTGHLHDPSYASGAGYAAWLTSVLKILGLEYPATDWLSPLIGSIGLIVMGVFLLQIARQMHSVPPVGMVAVFVAPFLFAGFVGRIRETTHKLLTFTVIFMLLYVAFNFAQARHEERFRWVFFVGIVTLSALNFFWATIYGTLLTVAFAVTQLYRGKHAKPTLVFLPSIIGMTMALWSPLTDFRVGAFVAHYIVALVTSTPSSPTITGRASAWPAIDVVGVPVSLGLVFSAGILIAGGLTALAILHIVYRQLRGRPARALDTLLFAIAILTGGLFVGLLVAGGLPTAKRIIPLSGVLGVLYWVVVLSREDTPEHDLGLAQHRTTLLRSLCVVIVIGAALGVPRMMPDGRLNPNKFYADDSDVERVEWAGEYGEDCVANQQVDRIVAAEIGVEVAVNQSTGRPANRVYSGEGREATMTCPG